MNSMTDSASSYAADRDAVRSRYPDAEYIVIGGMFQIISSRQIGDGVLISKPSVSLGGAWKSASEELKKESAATLTVDAGKAPDCGVDCELQSMIQEILKVRPAAHVKSGSQLGSVRYWIESNYVKISGQFSAERDAWRDAHKRHCTFRDASLAKAEPAKPEARLGYGKPWIDFSSTYFEIVQQVYPHAHIRVGCENPLDKSGPVFFWIESCGVRISGENSETQDGAWQQAANILLIHHTGGVPIKRADGSVFDLPRSFSLTDIPASEAKFVADMLDYARSDMENYPWPETESEENARNARIRRIQDILRVIAVSDAVKKDTASETSKAEDLVKRRFPLACIQWNEKNNLCWVVSLGKALSQPGYGYGTEDGAWLNTWEFIAKAETKIATPSIPQPLTAEQEVKKRYPDADIYWSGSSCWVVTGSRILEHGFHPCEDDAWQAAWNALQMMPGQILPVIEVEAETSSSQSTKDTETRQPYAIAEDEVKKFASYRAVLHRVGRIDSSDIGYRIGDSLGSKFFVGVWATPEEAWIEARRALRRCWGKAQWNLIAEDSQRIDS